MKQGLVRQWVDFLALLSIGLAVVVLTVVLPGRARTERLRAQRDRVRSDVEAVKGDVDRLVREIDAFTNDPWMIERRLRSTIHFLRPGERVLSAQPNLPRPSRPEASPRRP